jgi:hypothetical protein
MTEGFEHAQVSDRSSPVYALWVDQIDNEEGSTPN